MAVELYPHQEKAVGLLRNGSVLRGGVGSGKTHTALAYYLDKETPESQLIVITTAKKRDSLDWNKAASDLGIGTKAGGSVAGTLTVDSWNNISKFEDVHDAFFIFDEQRLVGSGAWVKSFYKIVKHNKWILLTATPADTWMDLIPVFVANGFYKNKTEFIREHVIYNNFTTFPKVEGYRNVRRLHDYRNRIYVEMPVERHTTRHLHIIDVDHDKDLLEKAVKKRWDVFLDEPMKDVSHLFRVMRRIVNSDPSRQNFVQDLLEKHPKIIVFYSFDYELESLRSLFNTERSSCDELSKSLRNRLLEAKKVKNLLDLESQLPTDSEVSPATQRNSGKNTKQKFDGGFEKNESKLTTLKSSSEKQNERPRSQIDVHVKGETLTSVLQKDVTEKHAPNFELAEWNGHKHEPIPETDSWVYLVQYTAGAEGWNCVETDTVVFYSLQYSYKIFEQCQGRIDRINTEFEDLHYYVLRSKSKIDFAIWQALKLKKNFSEKSWQNVGKTG